ncbi:hypothetical protein Bateq7PJ16_2296 [Bacillus subtilis]|nr:hypothetical protein Bateq7PJ16_2296 [Bacillus subtilis]
MFNLINKTAIKLQKENEELKEGLKWLYDCYKATLSNKPVKNLDEVFVFVETLLKNEN